MTESRHGVIRLRWLAALAALLLLGMSAVRAESTASAAVLCHNGALPCPEGDDYLSGTALNGTLIGGSVSFVGEKFTLGCGSSSISGSTTAASPVVGQIVSLSFSSCELGCSVEARNLPYKAEFEAGANGDGTVVLSSSGSGPPQIKDNCFGLTCTMGASKVSLDLDAGHPAALAAKSEPLVREGGEKAICGETAKWSGSYAMTEPMAMSIAARIAPPLALCSTSASPCPEGGGYPNGTPIHGALASAQVTFAGESSNLRCTNSTLSGSVVPGSTVVGEIDSLNFSSCEPSCTTEARNLPYKAEIEAGAGGDGTLTLSSGGSGNPQIRDVCFGQTCTMGASKISLDLKGGSPAQLVASSEPLVREGGEKAICGETAKMTATYNLEPASLFVEPAESRKLYFGISANARTDGTSAEEDAAETGVDRLREDLEWNVIEPSKGSWSWTKFDTLFQTAAERGMSILPILGGSPCWVVPEISEPEKCEATLPPTNSDYAEFVSRAVARYGPGGEFWIAHPKLKNALAPTYFELWNEPYFANGGVNPARYASLYRAAVEAGRSADASSRYLVESTGGSWPAAMVEADAQIGEYIDGIAVHPYPLSSDPYFQPANSTEPALAKAEFIYQAWKGKGVNRPVWITEVGYSSCSNTGECVFGETQANREQLKALWLGDLFDQLGGGRYSFVHAVYLYNLRQFENPALIEESPPWYGILNKKGEHLPGWAPFAEAVEDFDGVPLGHALILTHATGAGTASFTFTTTDPTAATSCQLDAGAWTACPGSASYTGLGGGSHTFRVKAKNAEGEEPSPTTYSW
jgi:hypothetical protein